MPIETENSTNDAEALLACRYRDEGDQIALDTLLAGMRPDGFRLAFRVLHHREDADDVVQDACVAFLDAVNRWDPAAAPPRIYFLGIVANLARRRLREGRRREPGTFMGEPLAPEAPPEVDAIAVQAVTEALKQLPARQRTIIEQHVVAGRKLNDIATDLDLPDGTVRSDLHRALKTLSQTLRRKGVSEIAVVLILATLVGPTAAACETDSPVRSRNLSKPRSVVIITTAVVIVVLIAVVTLGITQHHTVLVVTEPALPLQPLEVTNIPQAIATVNVHLPAEKRRFFTGPRMAFWRGPWASCQVDAQPDAALLALVTKGCNLQLTWNDDLAVLSRPLDAIRREAMVTQWTDPAQPLAIRLQAAESLAWSTDMSACRLVILAALRGQPVVPGSALLACEVPPDLPDPWFRWPSQNWPWESPGRYWLYRAPLILAWRKDHEMSSALADYQGTDPILLRWRQRFTNWDVVAARATAAGQHRDLLAVVKDQERPSLGDRRRNPKPALIDPLLSTMEDDTASTVAFLRHRQTDRSSLDTTLALALMTTDHPELWPLIADRESILSTGIAEVCNRPESPKRVLALVGLCRIIGAATLPHRHRHLRSLWDTAMATSDPWLWRQALHLAMTFTPLTDNGQDGSMSQWLNLARGLNRSELADDLRQLEAWRAYRLKIFGREGETDRTF